MTLPKAGNFYDGGLWGFFFTRYRIKMKFRLGFRLKPSNDRGEFELDRVRSKHNIAKNSFALAFKTHSTMFIAMSFQA